MGRFHLTRKAVDDLTEIWEYTLETWSENQADIDYRQLLETCRTLASKPELGRTYADISNQLLGYHRHGRKDHEMTLHAFLRGINVGGHHKVPMAALRTSFEAMGFTSVRTLLNSGNVTFDSERADLGVLESEIGARLEADFGFPIPVIIRTAESLRALVDADPFAGIEAHADIRLYISFTRSGDAIPTVVDLRDSKTEIAMMELERRFGKEMTTRNWNTLLKLGAASP